MLLCCLFPDSSRRPNRHSCSEARDLDDVHGADGCRPPRARASALVAPINVGISRFIWYVDVTATGSRVSRYSQCQKLPQVDDCSPAGENEFCCSGLHLKSGDLELLSIGVSISDTGKYVAMKKQNQASFHFSEGTR